MGKEAQVVRIADLERKRLERERGKDEEKKGRGDGAGGSLGE